MRRFLESLIRFTKTSVQGQFPSWLMSELPTYQSLNPTDDEPPSYLGLDRWFSYCQNKPKRNLFSYCHLKYVTPKQETIKYVLGDYLAEFIANTVIEDDRHNLGQPELTPPNFSTPRQQTSSIQSIISQQQLQAKAEIQGELITRTTLITVAGVLCGMYIPAFIPLVAIGFMFHVISISYQVMRYRMMFGGLDFNEESIRNQQQQHRRQNHAPNYRISPSLYNIEIWREIYSFGLFRTLCFTCPLLPMASCHLFFVPGS